MGRRRARPYSTILNPRTTPIYSRGDIREQVQCHISQTMHVWYVQRAIERTIFIVKFVVTLNKNLSETNLSL